MTYKCAEYFGNLDNEYLGCRLQVFAKKYGAKHTPGVVAVKAIASRLAMKQRKRIGFELEVTNESKRQLAEKTGCSEGSIGDVIKFLEFEGLCKTVRRGGGKNKVPTVRHMITTGLPIEFQSKHRGIIPVLNGKRTELEGMSDDQDGELPDTPKELPKEIAHEVCVCESVTSYKTSKEEEKNKHNLITEHLIACEDKTKSQREFNSLSEDDPGYISLLLEINGFTPSHEKETEPSEPSLKDEVSTSLSVDMGIDELEKTFNFDETVNEDEYSMTPADVKNLMTCREIVL